LTVSIRNQTNALCIDAHLLTDVSLGISRKTFKSRLSFTI